MITKEQSNKIIEAFTKDFLNVQITQDNLKRLMKENPQINIKNGNELYFKIDKKVKGGIN